MEFCGENQLTMVIQRGSDQLFGELITLKDQILMPIISHSAQCSPAPSSLSASSPSPDVQNTFRLYDLLEVLGSLQARHLNCWKSFGPLNFTFAQDDRYQILVIIDKKIDKRTPLCDQEKLR